MKTTARSELDEYFKTFDFSVEISRPLGEVYDNWPHIAYKVKIGSEIFGYSLGVGHVDWKKALNARYPGIDPYTDDGYIVAVIQGKSQLPECNKKIANIAAIIARCQEVNPDPAEVLAVCCAEGRNAQRCPSFEIWALEFGADPDSRKLEKIYNQFLKEGSKVQKLLGNHPGAIDRFIELYRNL